MRVRERESEDARNSLLAMYIVHLHYQNVWRVLVPTFFNIPVDADATEPASLRFGSCSKTSTGMPAANSFICNYIQHTSGIICCLHADVQQRQPTSSPKLLPSTSTSLKLVLVEIYRNKYWHCSHILK